MEKDHQSHDTLLPLVRQLFETDPVTGARHLEALKDEQVMAVLKALPPPLAAKALSQLQITYSAEILRDADSNLFQEIIQRLEPRHAATIFMHLPREVRETFVNGLSDQMKKRVQEHLAYPEGSVGRLMTTQFLSFRQDMKVQDCIERIRRLAQKRFPSSYLYVLDKDDHLVGVLNMRDLMLADPEVALDGIMRREVFSMHGFTPREEAASELSKRRFFAVPVVDGENRMVGIIKAEQLMQQVKEEISEDIQTMFGAGADERAFSPMKMSLRLRLPWLMVNLATAFLAAGVVAFFESTIARLTVLAVFLPVVAGQGGNAGAQSLAIVMRGLVMREIPADRAWRLVGKEGFLGILTGLATGLVTAGLAWAWHGNGYLGLVIGLAMVINLCSAGLAGASIPILMRKMGLDPAQCSSIILTTVTDVVGFMAFLGLAVLFMAKLV